MAGMTRGTRRLDADWLPHAMPLGRMCDRGETASAFPPLHRHRLTAPALTSSQVLALVLVQVLVPLLALVLVLLLALKIALAIAVVNVVAMVMWRLVAASSVEDPLPSPCLALSSFPHNRAVLSSSRACAKSTF